MPSKTLLSTSTPRFLWGKRPSWLRISWGTVTWPLLVICTRLTVLSFVIEQGLSAGGAQSPCQGLGCESDQRIRCTSSCPQILTASRLSISE